MSGGGAKGAYALGALRAILTGAAPSTGRPVEPSIFAGTSVGAFNATLLASQPGVPSTAALDRLERIWRSRVSDTGTTRGNGVFRIRGLPGHRFDLGSLVPTPARVKQLMRDSVSLGGEIATTANRMLSSRQPMGSRLMDAFDASAFFDPEPLRSLLTETVDFDGLARSGKELSIVASDWREATPRVFAGSELVKRRDVQPLLASMAIPGIFPPVFIDGVPYVDGGLSMNAPIKPAIRAGADVIHVIYLDRLPADVGPSSFATVDTIARLFSILSAEQVKGDLRRAHQINVDLDRPRAADPERRHRRVEIHAYRPQGALARGAALLDFGIDHIDALIKRGYDDAVQHDCGAAECSRP
jgi:NTE family protein